MASTLEWLEDRKLRVRLLDLSENTFGDEGAAAIGTFMANQQQLFAPLEAKGPIPASSMIRLDLRCNGITTAGFASALASLHGCRYLSKLHLGNFRHSNVRGKSNSLGCEGAEALFAFISSLPPLLHLDVSGLDVAETLHTRIELLGSLRTLHTLNVARLAIPVAAYARLLRALADSTIHTLVLDENPLDSSLTALFIALIKAPRSQLRSLSLANCSLVSLGPYAIRGDEDKPFLEVGVEAKPP